MKKEISWSFALWGIRLLLAATSCTLLFLWVRGEFNLTPSRGSVVAPWYVHYFFLGISGFSLVGLVCSFWSRLLPIGSLIALGCSGLVWASIVLMMVRVVPPWFWLSLTLVMMTLPISLALILLMPRASATSQKSLVASFFVAVLALIFITIKPPWHLQVFANTRVLDGEVTFWNEHHQTDHATLLGRFRFDFMLWSLSGYPPHYHEYDRQREALVRLGYFQKRPISLEGIRLHHVTPALNGIPTRDGLWTIIPTRNKEGVTVYACKADMPLIKTVFSEAKARQKVETSENSAANR